MKKFLSVTLIVTVIALSVFSVSAASFTDLTEAHWAYANIMELVSDGTINGYADGTFNPEGTVTRAEFVKMLGKSPVMRTSDFDDVAKDHWCYDYIMYSGLEALNGNNFAPDTPIVRGDVANLLYARFSDGIKAVAPHFVKQQGTNADASAWVYSYGIMMGDDKIDLRLGDTLTRAEAAALIVRAKNLDLSAKKNFIDNFSDDIYEKIYNSSNLFDTPYDANGTISNGEIATAALRYQFRDRAVPLGNFYYEKKFEGDYAAEWDIMCNYALTDCKYTSSEAESKENASIGNAVKMISYAALHNRIFKPIDKNTNDASYTLNDFVNDFGVTLYANADVNSENAITKKEVACILMQYDASLSMHIAYRCGYECSYEKTPISTDVASYPSNSGDYMAIFKNIPARIYEAPYTETVVKTAADTANATISLATLFVAPLNQICQRAYEKGITVYITYYPTLVPVTSSGYMYRLKLDVENAPEGCKLSDVFNLGVGVPDIELTSGSSHWIDLSTNAVLASLYIDYEIMALEQVIE